MIYLHITVICIISTLKIQCDATLQRTLGTELKIARYTENHVEQLATTVSRLEREIDKLLSSKWSNVVRADYVSTPLTALVMVRRLVLDWLPLTTIISRFSKLNHLPLGSVRWPTISDLEGAARAVMRTQTTYDLNTALLVRGVQSDMFLSNVTVADCFEVARQYFMKERFSEANEWLEHALARIHDNDDAPSRETLLYYRATALCFSGDTITSVNIIRSILRENPLSKTPNDLTDYYSIMGTRGCVYPDVGIYRRLDSIYTQAGIDLASVYFNRNKTGAKEHSILCRGEVTTDSRLACRYVHYKQPHLRFQPFKMEELHLDPPVVRFYDLVSDKEAESLMRQAKHRMEPASVGVSSRSRQTDYRTSYVTWLNPENTDWLTRRISEATRLDAYYADNHQVSRYSVSGEYLPHLDSFGDAVDWIKDRIATVMFYLNDVEQGGNTIFTHWKTSVPPVKNSAVLWFNYKPNGEVDEGSKHSGCPVLKGTKWVLNKWILNGGNHVNFPCTLDKEGSFKGFYL